MPSRVGDRRRRANSLVLDGGGGGDEGDGGDDDGGEDGDGDDDDVESTGLSTGCGGADSSPAVLLLLQDAPSVSGLRGWASAAVSTASTTTIPCCCVVVVVATAAAAVCTPRACEACRASLACGYAAAVVVCW